ncbi:MAG: hypothetical protein WAW46_14210 [Polaromonas sp.]
MKSRFLPSVVVAVAALTSMGASAQLLSQWLFDQMSASSPQTPEKVKVKVSQPEQEAKAQPKPDSAAAEKADSTGRVNAEIVQTKQP